MQSFFKQMTIVVSLLCHFVAFANEVEKDDFDSIYIHIATDFSLRNMDSAIILADSLLESSSHDPIRKMRSLMLLASLKNNSGDVMAALVYATRAEKIAVRQKNKEWQMRIAGFLYSTYNAIGLRVQGKEYLNKVERLNKTEKIDLIQLYIHQEKALSYLEGQLPQESLSELVQSDSLMKSLTGQRIGPILVATSYQLKGLAYTQLNELEKAKGYFFKAKELLPNDLSVLSGYINVGLTNIYLKEGDIEKSFYYLEKTEPILEGSRNFELNILLNDAWKAYYIEKGEYALADQHKKRSLELKSKKANYLEELSNQLILELREDLDKKDRSSWMLVTLISSLVVLLVMVIINNRDRIRRQEEKIAEVKDWFEDE